MAVEAALHEAVAGPKPGLVDRFNCGAHSDMDLFTFCSSASVLYTHFRAMASTGASFESADLTGLLEMIRPEGIRAEQAMLKATGGINTHKGLIFSMGILAAAVSRDLKQTGRTDSRSACRTASAMCFRIVERELKNSDKRETNGEKLFGRSGTRGIRGEAEEGFPSVINCALPALKQSSGSWNDRLVDTLLNLMTLVEDSNVLARGGREALDRMKRQAGEALQAGGASSREGLEILKQMDLDFMERNISPGGCADLLALTIFLYNLEQRFSQGEE